MMSASQTQKPGIASAMVICNSSPPPKSDDGATTDRDLREDQGAVAIEQVTPIFRNLSADDPDPEVTEIESLCVQCGANGITKLMLTKIPFYKEVILMSFKCGSCEWRNSELQSAAEIQGKGVQFKLNVKTVKDLARQVVKTEWASVTVPELQFEIPPCTQGGTVTTVEGVLQRALDGLKTKLDDPEVKDTEQASQLKTFLFNLRNLIKGNVPFTFILCDCSGNSFLENICAPHVDPELEVTYFARSEEENNMLGIKNSDAKNGAGEQATAADLKDEVLQFPTNCSFCGAPTFTNMKVTEIPHFKDVVIMATTCDECGNKTTEVKSGSGIQPLGKKISLKITSLEDLKRDLVKSETCSILIPELELEVGAAALGGRYTTVEGLLTNIREQLSDSNPLLCGDSAVPERKQQMDAFLSKLHEVITGKHMVTVILDDPCGNSYLEHFNSPSGDPNLEIVEYQRSKEQEEELGITDMKTENYEGS